MHEIAYNSFNVDQLCPKNWFCYVLAFRPHIRVPNFSQINPHIGELFWEVCKKRFFWKFDCSYLRNSCKNFFKLEMWPSLSEGHLRFIVNLVPFESDITEVRMHENCSFVFSCQCTHFVHACLVFLGCMTNYHVSWFETWKLSDYQMHWKIMEFCRNKLKHKNLWWKFLRLPNSISENWNLDLWRLKFEFSSTKFVSL